MQKHSKIGASGAKRWMSCPGSVRLSDGIANRTSEYAAEGTAAHTLAENCLRTGTPVQNWKGKSIEGFVVNTDMAEAVNVYIESCNTDFQPGDEQEFEVRFALSELHTGLFGTADRVRYRPATRTLRITDYKHGAGVPVEVEENPQLMYYALGAIYHSKLPVWDVELEIIQPRCPHPDGPVRMWKTDIIELIEFADKLKEAAFATEDPEAPLVTGEHCRWCPAAGFCPALAKKALKAAQTDFGPALAYEPGELAEALEILPTVEQWVKSVRAFAYEEALAGRIPPGHKLVEKRATRKWRDDEKAASALQWEFGMPAEDIFDPPKLKSPAQIEEKYGKKNKGDLSELITSETSGTTLASLKDRRPAVAKSTATDDFSPVGDNGWE